MTDRTSKPCFICGNPSELLFGNKFFDPERAFKHWADKNKIISSWRSRFDGVRDRLEWAALDETNEGAHANCTLEWAIKKEGFANRYPLI